MKPREVRKLLNCSYTSLKNWVKTGKLKYVDVNSKRHDYNDESVYQLYDEMFGKKKLHDRIDVFLKNKKYEFNVPPEVISKVLDLINSEIKKEMD